MSEVIDANAESESVRDDGVGLEEDEEIDHETSFPRLIATQETTQSATTGKTNPTPSVTSSSGNRNKYRVLADALFLEAQEVERQGERRVGYATVSELAIDSSPQVVSQEGYIIVRGDGKTDFSNGGSGTSANFSDGVPDAVEEFEPDIDSLFLTQDEQRKK
jgi:hypothetical protein